MDQMSLHQTRALLSQTRLLTVLATVFLSVQLSGNLYEELVTNAGMISSPQPGALVGELAAGSPLYFYLPWAPLGVLLAATLTVKLRRQAPKWIFRRCGIAMFLLAGAIAVKGYLISSVNPLARDASITTDALRASAVHWAFINGLAIVLVGTAIWLLVSWRAKVLDSAT